MVRELSFPPPPTDEEIASGDPVAQGNMRAHLARQRYIDVEEAKVRKRAARGGTRRTVVPDATGFSSRRPRRSVRHSD